MSNLPIKSVPKYEELVQFDENKAKANDLQVILNHEPPANWVKANDHANGSCYLPIDKVEYLLTRLFIKWWVQVLDYKVIANSCAVHIRLFYIDPITGETLSQDGLGAAPMQTEKGAGATNFDKIKNAAVQMALPAAETYAIKDAAEKIGRIFGKDLNRKDLMAYDSLAGRFDLKEDPEIKRIAMMIGKAQSKQDLEKIKPFLRTEVQELFDTKMSEVK